MAYEGTFTITFDVVDVDDNLLDGKLIVELQNDASYAALGGSGLVVLDRYLPAYGRYPVKVDGGYVLSLPTDVPNLGDPDDSDVGYELTFETDGGTVVHALFAARPEGSNTLLSALADAFETVDPVTSAANAAAAAASAAAAAASAASVAAKWVSVKDYGATGDGTTDDTLAIQAAIDDLSSPAARPGTVWFPSSDGPGAYKITDTLTVSQAGMILAAPGRSTSGSGARLVWAGATDGTMLEVDAERVQVQNLGFDGDDVAATLIAATSKRGLQLLNVFGTGYAGDGTTGAGLMLGDGGANLNEFSSSGLHLQGTVAGAVSIVIDSTATELMRFTNTVLNCSPADVGLASHVLTDTNVLFDGLTMDDGAMTDYAIKSSAGTVQLLSLASEVPKLYWSAAVGRQGITKIQGQVRSLAPGSGEYAIHLQGVGHFHLEGRLQRKAGATYAPNVQIGSTVLGVVEEGLLWESADSAAVGTYVGNPSKVLSVARTRGVVEALSRSGSWRVPDHTTRTTGTSTLSRCLYVPIRVRKTTIFDRISCEVTTGVASAVTRLGLYRSADGWPDAALYRSVNLDSSVTGEVYEDFATDLTVDPGLYFLSVVAQTAQATYRTSATFTEAVSPVTSPLGAAVATVYYQGSIGAALPSTAGPTADVNSAPLVWLRVA
jgi:hypothetical protein